MTTVVLVVMQFVDLIKEIFVLINSVKIFIGTHYEQITLLDTMKNTELNKKATLCNFKEIILCNVQICITLLPLISDTYILNIMVMHDIRRNKMSC